VTTAGGASNALNFKVTVPPAPTLTGISPNSGVQGSSVNVSVAGTNLTAASAINAGAGITVSNLTVVGATQVTATFLIGANATAGLQNVTITTPRGTRAVNPAAVFTINAAPRPTLTSISPAAGTQAASVRVTLTGTNLTGASAINAGAG